jgi:hypothetical protein
MAAKPGSSVMIPVFPMARPEEVTRMRSAPGLHSCPPGDRAYSTKKRDTFPIEKRLLLHQACRRLLFAALVLLIWNPIKGTHPIATTFSIRSSTVRDSVFVPGIRTMTEDQPIKDILVVQSTGTYPQVLDGTQD